MTWMAQSQLGNGWFRAQKWLKLLNYLYLAKGKKIRIEGWPAWAIWAISKMARLGNGLKVYIITKLLTYFKKIKTIYKVQNNWELAWKAKSGFGPNGPIGNWPESLSGSESGAYPKENSKSACLYMCRSFAPICMVTCFHVNKKVQQNALNISHVTMQIGANDLHIYKWALLLFSFGYAPLSLPLSDLGQFLIGPFGPNPDRAFQANSWLFCTL